MPTEQNAPATGANDTVYVDTTGFLSGTKHLSLEQVGAYMHLFMEIHRTGSRSILDDPGRAARTIGCSKQLWLKTLRPALLPLFDRHVGEV